MTAPKQKSEEQWKAEDDAHTLAAAHAISKDPKRLKAAQEAAKTLHPEMKDRAQEAGDQADAMQKLAGQMYPTMPQEGGNQ